jgi:tetratricopeptide (TPR) repeat protein
MKRIYNIATSIAFAISLGIGIAPAAIADNLAPHSAGESQSVIEVDSYDFLVMAEEALEVGDYQNAIFHANRAMDLEPALGNPYLIRGQARAYQGDTQAAIADLEQAAQRYRQNNNQIGYLLALTYLRNLNKPNSPQALTLPEFND